MYTQALPSCRTHTPLYLNDAYLQDGTTQDVDTTGHLLNLVGKILKGDNVSAASRSTFEDVCKDGIKQRINDNKGKIILGIGLFFVASAAAGYQAKKHEMFKKFS